MTPRAGGARGGRAVLLWREDLAHRMDALVLIQTTVPRHALAMRDTTLKFGFHRTAGFATLYCSRRARESGGR